MRDSQSGRSLLAWVTLLCLGTLAACSVTCLCSNSATEWEQTAGPPGGRVSCVAVDIDEPNIVYAGLGELGIYRSTDGGTTWESSKIQMGGWIGNITSTPHGVFASCGNFGLFRTTNHGLSWDLVEVAHETRITGMNYSLLGDVFLAKSEWGKLYASHDGGSTWLNVGGNLPHARISAMAASGPIEYWIAKGERGELGVFHTADGGKSWEQSSLPQIRDAGVGHIFVDRDDPDLILVGFGNIHNEVRFDGASYSWISRNGGASWSPVWGFFDPDNGWWPLAQGLDGALFVNNANHLYVSYDRARTWQRLRLVEGLEGRRPGDIGNMTVHPADPNVLFVPVLNGVAVSRDSGWTWRVENAGMILTQVSLLAVDPIDPAVVYAASAGGEGTFRSEDRGNTWTWLNGGGLPHPWVDELLVHPTDSSTIYEIVDTSEVYRSDNHGATWTTVWDEFQFSSVYALAAAPSDPNVVYACKNGFGLFKSVQTGDGGDAWRFLHQSLVDYTYTIAIHPENPDIVFSGYNSKPFQDWAMIRRSTDGGTTWETALHVDGSEGITSIVFDPSDSNVLYATSIGENGGTVYVSRDGGDSWEPLNERFTMCTVWGQPQLVGDPEDPDTVYAATWLGGTWKTTDAGASWALVEAPISATALSVDPLHPDVLFLGDRSTPTVWRSLDAGGTWDRVADFAGDGALLAMRVLVHDGTVYASTFHHGLSGGDLYRSRDNGDTWDRITGSLPKGILDIAVDPHDTNVIYVTTNINSAYVSRDGGDTWSHIGGFPDVGAYDIEIHPTDSSILYTSARGGSLPDWFTQMSGDHADGIAFSQPAGVYRSIDKGATWEQILETLPSCRAVRVHPDHPELVFAVDLFDGLLVSRDAGVTWMQENAGIETLVPTSLVVSGERLYIGTQACGVWSADLSVTSGTLSWQPERSNKPVPTVHSAEIQVDPNNPDVLFVSAYPGGLMRSTDGGVTWGDRNGINPSIVVADPLRQGYYTFAIDPTNSNEMWLGTWGSGVYRSHDAMLLNVPAFGEQRTMLGVNVYRLVLDPTDPAQVYAATEQGVFHTGDDGATWEQLNEGLPTSQVRTLAFTADGRLIAGTLGYGIYAYDQQQAMWYPLQELRDFGTFWPIWAGRPLYQYSTLLIDPIDSDTMYFGTFPAGIYKTTDGGEHWLESNVGWTNDGVFCLVFHPQDTDVIYAGTYNGINRSLDGGEHWQLWDEGWPPEQWVFSIAFDAIDPEIMYACSKNGENEGEGRPDFHGTVMKSTDGGEHWFPITQGLNISQEFLKIIVDPQEHNTLYLATQNQGVCISNDAGESWRLWNEGLECHAAGTNGNNVANVLGLSSDGQTLYFATFGAGVWRRTIDR